MRLRVVAVGAAMAAGLVACGSGGGTVAKSQGGKVLLASGYLAATSSFVSFFQWNQSGNTFSGSAQEFYPTGTVPNMQTRASSGTVSGTLTGTRVELQTSGLDASGCSNNPCFGQLSNGTLTLNVPQSNGALNAAEYRVASTADYNDAVAQVTGEVAAANQAESNREAQAQAQQQQQQAQQQQAEAQAEAQQQAAFAAACSAHHGYVDGTACRVDYPGWPRELVTLNPDGSFNQKNADDAKTTCADLLSAYQQSAAGNEGGKPPNAHPPQYHPDTGVCTPQWG